MKIFKANADAAKQKEQESKSQRVQRERALRDRLELDRRHAEEEALEEPPALINKGLDDESDSEEEDASEEEPEFEVVPTSAEPEQPMSIPVVSQDDEPEDSPAANTRAQHRLRTLQDEANINLEATMLLVDAAGKPKRAPLMQQVMATKLDIAGAAMEVSAKQAASRRYPLQFLCDLANTVLDGDTGEMMEYRHLIARPKYKEVWGDAFGKEVGRLAQGIPGKVEGTDTLFFINKDEVPKDRLKDVTRDRIVCNVPPEKG